MTGPHGPEAPHNRTRAARLHRRESADAMVSETAVDLNQELTDVELDKAHTYAWRSHAWLLTEYRRRCRERGVSSLGRVFSEWLPWELAKALVLFEREAPAARFANGGTYRFE